MHIPTFNKPASIQSLPSEVLLRIFEELFSLSLNNDFDFDTPRTIATKYPTQFPYCIAKVCRRWKKLVRSVPLFSTRIMLFVDDPISLKEIEDQLAYLGTLLVKVFVIRKEYPETDNDQGERTAVDNVVRALSAHVRRCQVMVFDILHSSSLPQLTSFSGEAPKLRTIRIRCRRGAVESQRASQVLPRPAVPRREPKSFVCANLQYLDLHGRAYLEALEIPDWLESIRRLSQKSLAISHLTREEAGELDMRQFVLSLARIGHLTKLTLSHIELDTTSCMNGRAPGKLYIENFEFTGLSKEFITGFFAVYENQIEIGDLGIKQCGLGQLPRMGIASWKLFLHDIDATEDEVVAFVQHWNGFGLDLKDCNGVTDKLLDSLTFFYPFRDSEDVLYAPTLRQLQIHFSTPSPISPEAVKTLVMARKAVADNKKYDTPDRRNPLPMYSICISGSDYHLKEEDRNWFSNNLERFFWINPSIPDGIDSPMIKDDCPLSDFAEFDEIGDFEVVVPPSQPDSIASKPTYCVDYSGYESPALSDDYSNIAWC